MNYFNVLTTLVLVAIIYILGTNYYEFNSVVNNIIISFISSYIFYYIIVHLKEIKDKKNIDVFVKQEIKSIIHKYNALTKGNIQEIYGVESSVIFEISHIIRNIFSVMLFLDTELIKLLSEISNSKYCLSKINATDLNIRISSKDEEKYKELHKQLKKYYELNFKI